MAHFVHFGAPAPDPCLGPGYSDLPRTEMRDQALRMVVFALGLALVGIGLLVGNRRPALR